MKIVEKIILKIVIFTAVKNRCILHGRVFVLPSMASINDRLNLTHISLASFLWDIGKQNCPRWDAAKCGVPSGAILFAYIEK